MFVRVRNPRQGNHYDLDAELVDDAVAEGRVERLDSDQWPDSPEARPGLPKRALGDASARRSPAKKAQAPGAKSGTASTQPNPTAGDQHE